MIGKETLGREALEQALRNALATIREYRLDGGAGVNEPEILERQLKAFELGTRASETLVVDLLAECDGWVSLMQHERRVEVIVWAPEHKKTLVRTMANQLREELQRDTGLQAENRWKKPDRWLNEEDLSR
ncbi:MAG: hypothetical protein Q8R13_05195 [bacterium]|nr:hypothetical protein [bacterium]MDZ4296542.1 hypothetical protein [Patescibacteria group bacterium]